MEKLLNYLNALPAHERDLFAGRCGTTQNYMRKAISTGQTFGPALCVQIERATAGEIRRVDLRSDWKLIWPELEAAA